MKNPLLLAGITVMCGWTLLAQPRGSIPPLSDEFAGPFQSWANVKTVSGAVANGTVDDTAALQRGLDELGKPGHSPVLFLAGGAYRITKTLVLASGINLSIVGEDTATTTIVWDGEPGGTMLWLNGLAYSRFVRLTFDGKRRAAIAVDQSWDGVHPYFDTGNEYSDDRFVNVDYGIHGGLHGRRLCGDEHPPIDVHTQREGRAGARQLHPFQRPTGRSYTRRMAPRIRSAALRSERSATRSICTLTHLTTRRMDNEGPARELTIGEYSWLTGVNHRGVPK